MRKDPSVLQFIENVDPEFQSPLLLHFGQKSPYIPINIENKTVPFLIDTRAALSVLPKHKVLSLLTHFYQVIQFRRPGRKEILPRLEAIR